MGLDEERPRVDQLHALQSLTRRRVQVLTLSHLGLAVPGQLQDGLRHGGGVRRGDLRRRRTQRGNQTQANTTRKEVNVVVSR